MKRFHIHISVQDQDQNIAFYAQVFNTKPSVVKDDYAKWALDNPALNFAISTRSNKVGLDHVGIQTDSDEELTNLRTQLESAGIQGVAQENATCCADEHCPVLLANIKKIHWPLNDPAKASGSEEYIMEVFRASRDDIRDRVKALIDRYQ